jgi:hypothetical protein
MSVLQIVGLLGIPAAVSLIVTAVINYRSGLRKVYTEYELEQQRELRALMGRYTGRMLEAAIDWDRRMMQLYEYAESAADNKDDPDFNWHMMCPGWWLRLGDDGDGSPSAVAQYRRDPEYYFYLSVVFRFLSLLAIARRFEAQAFYIDARHVKNHQNELYFLRYAKSFLWAMTYSGLSPDDGFPGADHFISDKFRPMLDLCYKKLGQSRSEAPQGQPIFDWDRFLALLQRKSESARGKFDPAIDQVLEFFDELRPVDYAPDSRKRRRWERLICLHLLTLNFIATFGYPWQQDIAARRAKAIKFLSMDSTVIEAFMAGSKEWLGLEDQDHMKSLQEALRLAVSGSRAVPDDSILAEAVTRLTRMGAREVQAGGDPTALRDQADHEFSVNQEWLEYVGWRVRPRPATVPAAAPDGHRATTLTST